MGEVFLAHDTKLERKVAIKMLPAKSLDDAHAKKRLLREAKAAATLDHPNICGIHEVNEEGDCLFIVMQYVEGETLADKLVDAALSPETVIEVGIQVAEALAEAHAHGIIHRDIKPPNVIITPRGQVKVLDFGLAQVARIEQTADSESKTDTQLTQEGHIVGTVAYMSPEQLKGLPSDGRSDLFSLGVLLYECATGKPAFAGTSKVEISSKVLQVEPHKPSLINPGIPPQLENIILKAMAKDPESRYQSAAEMVKDLSRLRSSLSDATATFPSAARAPSRLTISEVPSRLFKLRPLLFLIPLVVVAVGLAWYFWPTPPYEPSADARKWYDQGLMGMRVGTYFQASKALERAVELDDRYAPAHARLAEAYLEMSKTEEAMEELLRAVSVASERGDLTSADAAYLDAIGATIRREFESAINFYQKILDQTPNANKATAYVELGRAYERNENLDQATQSYLEATNLDAQSPAAFLRLAILYSRRQEAAKAEASFKTAETLYQTMSNDEGRVEVLLQRGAMLARTGKLPQARNQLEQVLEILKNVENKYQLVRAQLQLSLVSRDEGNLDRAKQLAADAIALAQNANIRSIATQGLIDLGLALMSRGDFEDSARYLRQALDLARQDKSRSGEARAILALGRLNQQLGNNDEAIAQLQEALNFFKPAGYRKETSVALTALGRAYQEKGETETALKIFQEQFELSRESGDQAGVGESYMNLALLRGYGQEMYPDAVANLDEKVKIDEQRAAKIGLAFDHMNRGNFLWQLGKYPEARAALDAAFEIANRPEANYKAALAWVHLTRAQMALSESKFSEAKKNAELALAISASQIPDVILQAKFCLGRAQAFSGAVQTGRKSCEEAVTMAKQLNAPQLISAAQLAYAEVLLIGRDSQLALSNALEAQKTLARSGGQDSEWRALLIAARASQLAGNRSESYEYASRADKLCAGLEQKWGKENYQSYLRRPDIQNYRNQIAQILNAGN